MTEIEIGYRRLAACVVLQAIDDWNRLLKAIERGKYREVNGMVVAGRTFRKGKDYLPTYNFREIENFIERSAELFCDIQPERILPDLHNRLESVRVRARKRYHY